MSEDSGGATTYSAESYPMSTKTLSSTVNAAPFVPATAFPRPGEGPGEERPAMFQRRAASVMGFSADAPEFVPSGKGEVEKVLGFRRLVLGVLEGKPRDWVTCGEWSGGVSEW